MVTSGLFFKPMPDPLLVYGATGFTGRLVVEALLASGVRPVLGGRNRERLQRLAADLGLEYRVASLDTPEALAAQLADIDVLVLTAGPFAHTALSAMLACLDARTHYLDLTGECAVFATLATFNAMAAARGCMVMPGCGFDVVASDCLARHVSQRQPASVRLAIGLSGLATATRGSLRTIAEQAGRRVSARRDGALATVAPGAVRRQFDFGNGHTWATCLTWGDVVTAFHSTGIPNIEVFFEETPALAAMLAAGRSFGPLLQTPLAQSWLRAHADFFPEGPTLTERAVHRCVVVAEATDSEGRIAVSRLTTPEAYSFSATTAAAIARRALEDDVEPGFQTPARVYGADFVMEFDRVTREDLV